MIPAHRPYVRPTARQREVIVALVEMGSIAVAAARLGLSRTAAESHLRRARRRGGFRSNEHMVYVGTRDGWISVTEERHLSL